MKANRKMMFRRKLVYAAVISCFTVTPAFANPIGATVVNGQVGFATQGSTLTVTNTPNAIINWQQFSIGVGETTRFIQQSAQSAVLNRVVGQDPSQLLGSLLSNGRVYLINPNGILFGQGAVIDVGGLVASTLKLTDGDFLAGRLNFTDGVGAGAINNQGSITTPAGGNVYLVAPDITNSGIITSPQGEILLAAGHTVNLMDTTNPNVQVTVGAPDTQAVNIGSLIARSGKVGIYGALIDQQGLVDANTAVVGANGKITLKASKDITLEPGSVTTASGMAGGVKDGGEIRIVADGKLNVKSGSAIHVDGGVDGGNGGFLELSGKTGFSLRGIYTGRAQKAGYHNGSLLLDPLNINIIAGGSDGSGSLTSNGQILANASSGASFQVDPVNLNNGGWADVSLAALNDITVSSPISNANINNGVAGGSLTLTAGNDITVSAPIGASGTRFNHDLTLTANNNVNINKSIYLGNNLLKLAADADLSGTGNVIIQPIARSSAVVVDTLGELSVTGASLQVLGNTNASVTVNAHGGDASHNNTITVGSLTVKGGFASASASTDSSLPDNRVADAILHTDQNFVINTTTGGVTVQGGRAVANASGNGHSATASANAELSATGSLTIDSVGGLTVAGGGYNNSSSKALAWASGGASASASANALVKAGSMDITLLNSLGVYGGNYGSAHAAGNGVNTAIVTSNATISATDGDITISSASGDIRGAFSNHAFATGSGTLTAKVNGDAELSATGTLDITTTGFSGLTVQAGNATAYANGSATTASTKPDATASANATMSAGSLTLSARVLNIRGGGAHAQAGGLYSSSPFSFSGSAHNRSVTAEARALVSVGTVSEMTLGGGGLFIAGSGCHASCTAIVNGAGGTNSAFTDRSAFLRVAGDISSLTVSGNGITIYGGSSARATAGGSGINTAIENADAGITVGGSITSGVPGAVPGIGFLSMRGGSSANANVSGSGANKATATANALITTGGNITLDIAGDMNLHGGSAYASGSGAIAKAVALIESGTTQSGTMLVDAGGNVSITGGSGANNGNGLDALAFAGIVNTGPINMTIRGGSGLAFDGGAGGATYNNWTVPGTGLSPDPTSAISITYTNSGAEQVITPAPLLDAAFIMTRMSALPGPVLYAVDIGTDTLNNSSTFDAFIEPIRFGDSNEDKKNEKPVCR